nr:hypothetical protein [Tanacetum cinerariifolium]
LGLLVYAGVSGKVVGLMGEWLEVAGVGESRVEMFIGKNDTNIHPHFDDNPLSGSTTYSSNSLLEEFTDELALITYPPDYDDNLTCDIESDLREIEFLLYQGEDSTLKDLIDKTDLANLDDLFVDPTLEMFTDEHAPDYSFSLRFDVYLDDFLEIESDVDNFDDDSFDSKGEKIKQSKLLIDQLDLPCDILPHSEEEASNFFASLVFEDFDPPFYEPIVFKDVPNSMRLLPFSFENKEKVFKPGIYTSEKGKENQKKDKIRSKPDKNRKRGEAGKSQKQLQSIKQEKSKKTQVEGPKVQTHSKLLKEGRKKGAELQFSERSTTGARNVKV